MNRLTAGILVALVLTACGNDAATPADVAGTYRATLFQTTENGVVTDQIAAGATITVVLTANLRMSGRLFVPGGAEDGSDLDLDLSGAWTLLRNSVILEPTADTFLGDLNWVYVPGGTLTSAGTFGTTAVEVVLTR